MEEKRKEYDFDQRMAELKEEEDRQKEYKKEKKKVSSHLIHVPWTAGWDIFLYLSVVESYTGFFVKVLVGCYAGVFDSIS